MQSRSDYEREEEARQRFLKRQEETFMEESRRDNYFRPMAESPANYEDARKARYNRIMDIMGAESHRERDTDESEHGAARYEGDGFGGRQAGWERKPDPTYASSMPPPMAGTLREPRPGAEPLGPRAYRPVGEEAPTEEELLEALRYGLEIDRRE